MKKGEMNKGRMMRRRDNRQKGFNERQDEGWKIRYERESTIPRHLKINHKETAQQNRTLLNLYYTCLLSFLYKKFILS